MSKLTCTITTAPSQVSFPWHLPWHGNELGNVRCAFVDRIGSLNVSNLNIRVNVRYIQIRYFDLRFVSFLTDQVPYHCTYSNIYVVNLTKYKNRCYNIRCAIWYLMSERNPSLGVEMSAINHIGNVSGLMVRKVDFSEHFELFVPK